jgi:hypothetical protein
MKLVNTAYMRSVFLLVEKIVCPPPEARQEVTLRWAQGGMGSRPVRIWTKDGNFGDTAVRILPGVTTKLNFDNMNGVADIDGAQPFPQLPAFDG